MPAQAGIQELQAEAVDYSAWIPASAGMTPPCPSLTFTGTKYQRETTYEVFSLIQVWFARVTNERIVGRAMPLVTT